LSGDAWLTLAIVGATVVALARELLNPAATVLTGLVALLVFGVVTPEQAFSGFANPAPVTVAALYVLARAVEKTGGLQPILAATLGRGSGTRSGLARLLFPVAASSAFLNNTPIVAMLAPQVTEWSQRRGLSPSRFLMPLSFAAILGGLITVIGTSTNLVVSGLLADHGRRPLGMFELTLIGLPLAVSGVAYLVAFGPALLPERRAPRGELTDGVREFAVNMTVVPGGPLHGRPVAEGGLRHLQGVFLVEIEREGELIAPVAPTTVLHGGDRLTFVGKADLIVDLQSTRGLVSAERDQLAEFDTVRHTFFEVVVGAASPLTGKTVREAHFRGRYQAAVVAIHRAGERVRAKLGDVRLRVGDTLLLLTDPGFEERWRHRNDFLLVSRLGGSPPAVTRRAWIAALVGLGIVAVASSGLLPILEAALLGAVVLVASGVLSPGEAGSAVDLNVILVIAGSFGLGAAMESTGLAARLAELLVGGFSGLGDRGVLLGIVLATLALTEMITNNAAAILVFPIALSTSEALGIEPRGLAVGVAVAASASFLTPIGYQTNTMVYGPGRYHFSDYARLGFPLTVWIVLVTVWTVPLLWPLR
jgi:di/tricarboxylate transporter